MVLRERTVLYLGVAVSLAVAAAASTVLPMSPRGLADGTLLTESADFGNEGTLLLVPEAGINREMVEYGDPAMLSWTYADKEEAVRVVLESNARGDEPLCLSDLGPQKPEFHMARYWVFSC